VPKQRWDRQDRARDQPVTSGSHLQFTIEPPAKLSDLPIQRPEKFNLSVNLKTTSHRATCVARRADEVFE
jgi:hypothetical protein